jgi:hypothetical protein
MLKVRTSIDERILFVDQSNERVNSFTIDSFGITVLIMNCGTEKIHQLFLSTDLCHKNKLHQHLCKVHKLHIILFSKDLIKFGKFILKRLIFLLVEEIIEYGFEFFKAGQGRLQPF